MTSSSPIRVLILGGSSESSALAQALAARPDVAAMLSFAGRTNAMPPQPVPTRVGGFGGIDGLACYLRNERIDVLVDATHPFAAQMSAHAREAAQRAGCHLVKVSRAAWTAEEGDRWQEVASMPDACEALGPEPRRVFLTIGSLQLATFARVPQHHYLVRTIDPLRDDHGLADATFITARGPFEIEAETRLMQDHRIDVVVTKNSGGTAAAAKLAAARRLGLPVILVKRPGLDSKACSVDAALAQIEAHAALARRGV